MQYDDAYATCKRTYATLRIYPGGISPAEVTRQLGLVPSHTQEAIEARVVNGVRHAARPSGWFLSSDAVIESRDVRRHLDWLLDQLLLVRGPLHHLQSAGARVDVSCYWLSASGHGGPTVAPEQAQKIATLGLECWFDVYFTGGESDDDGGEGSPRSA